MKRVFVVSVLWLMFCLPVQAQTNTISGSISLPSGSVAGLGGVTFEIRTFPIQIIDDQNGFMTSSDEVTILASRRSVDFSFPLLDTDPVENQRIEFECVSGCGGSFTTRGFWSENDGVTGVFGATEYPNDQSHILDIVLEIADNFSGSVSLPSGFVAEGEEIIAVQVQAAGVLVPDNFSQVFSAQAGDTSWSFNLSIPRDATSGGWNVIVACLDCDADISPERHVPTTRSGDPMSLNEADAFRFPRDQNYSDINMTLISIAPEPEPEDPPVVAPITLLLDDG